MFTLGSSAEATRLPCQKQVCASADLFMTVLAMLPTGVFTLHFIYSVLVCVIDAPVRTVKYQV